MKFLKTFLPIALLTSLAASSKLVEAVYEENAATLLDLLENGADINAMNEDGWSALGTATTLEMDNMFTVLLEKGADVNLQNDSGWSPLHGAAMSGNENMCAVLLKKGANVNLQDDDGWSPLHGAAMSRNENMCAVLLKKGADVNVQDNDGWSPLMLSVLENRKQCFDVVLNHEKVALNAVNKNGENALHVAAGQGNETMCAVLLENGADFNAKDHENKTPLIKANEWRNITTLPNMCATMIQTAAEKFFLLKARNYGARHKGQNPLVLEKIKL